MQRRFSEEFKRAAVARVQSGESQLSVARHLGISSKTLNRWCVTARRAMPAEELSAMDEITRLRKLLRQRDAEIDLKKSGGVLRQNAVEKYAYLERCYGSAQIGRRSCLPIWRACEMLNISASGFYEWRHCDKAHRFWIVETDDFIVQSLKAVIKNSCGGHIPGVLVCYHYLREQELSIDLTLAPAHA